MRKNPESHLSHCHTCHCDTVSCFFYTQTDSCDTRKPYPTIITQPWFTPLTVKLHHQQITFATQMSLLHVTNQPESRPSTGRSAVTSWCLCSGSKAWWRPPPSTASNPCSPPLPAAPGHWLQRRCWVKSKPSCCTHSWLPAAIGWNKNKLLEQNVERTDAGGLHRWDTEGNIIG